MTRARNCGWQPPRAGLQPAQGGVAAQQRDHITRLAQDGDGLAGNQSPAHLLPSHCLLLDLVLTSFYLGQRHSSNADFQNENQMTHFSPEMLVLHHACGIHSSQLRCPQTQGGTLAQPQPDIYVSLNQSKLLIRRLQLGEQSATRWGRVGMPTASSSGCLIISSPLLGPGRWLQRASLLPTSPAGPNTQQMCLLHWVAMPFY